MWRVLVKHLSHGFAFVRGQGGDVNESLHPEIPYSRDNGPRIGVQPTAPGHLSWRWRGCNAAASLLSEVSGIGAAMTLSPAFSSGRMTLFAA